MGKSEHDSEDQESGKDERDKDGQTTNVWDETDRVLIFEEDSDGSMPPAGFSKDTNDLANKRLTHGKIDHMCEAMRKANKAVRQSGRPNAKGARIPVFSKINHAYLDRELVSYKDRQVTEFLEFGFPINHDGRETNHSLCKNHSGATLFSFETTNYLNTEVREGSSIGPIGCDFFEVPIALSPLNSVEKNSSTKERRFIVDLSFPPGKAVNEGIDKKTYMGETISWNLPGVDDLVGLIKFKGKGCGLFKRDLRRAYRQIPVDPGDIHLLGYHWRDQVYVDRTLPMGLRSAAYICQRVTNIVTYILGQKGVRVVNYLDDIAGCENWDCAQAGFDQMGEVLEQMGLQEASNKATAPSCRMTFLGVLFDTCSMTLAVTPDRLDNSWTELRLWLNRQHCTMRQL